MKALLLNADLGEWESAERRRDLFRVIDLANVACGGHAGDLQTMQACRELAEEFGVRTGAHPGLPFARGRELVQMQAAELRDLLNEQLDDYRASGLELHHLKLHGALYHMTEAEPALREVLIQIAAETAVPVLCLAGGQVERALIQAKLPALPEMFLDRHYLSDGNLVPRTHPQAHLTKAREFTQRLQSYHESGRIPTITGGTIPLNAKTACLHADSPHALQFAHLFQKGSGKKS